MAHKKGMGSTKNGRDSESKRLGVKVFGGQNVQPGSIILRQRGTKFHPGQGVGMGKDHTIYAKVDGQVVFRRRRRGRSYISVLPEGVPETHAVTASQPAATEAVREEPEATTATEAPVQEPKAPEQEAKQEQKEEADTAEPASASPETGDARAELLKSVGEASEADKDDLKEITGVGPSMEEKLNAIGIYKYEQVAKIGEKELELIGQLDSSLPGRIKEEWVTQAKELSN